MVRFLAYRITVNGLPSVAGLEALNFKNINKMNKETNTENKDLTTTFGNTVLYEYQPLRRFYERSEKIDPKIVNKVRSEVL